LVALPLGFATNLPGLDYVIAAALVVHVHWGLEAIVVDYIRPSIFGPVIPKVSLWLLYLLSIFSLGGLFYFNYTDVGIVNGVKMGWQKL
jgi:succinate dehydrogenase (ubiquinone) membrane anchor subunit